MSVIVTTFNAAAFVDSALESVRAQEYPPDELILCDDGSTDDTVAKVEAWEGQLGPTRLRILAHENAGLSVNRNRGLLAARGELIALLDVDDRYKSDHLSTLVPAFHAHPEIVIAFGNMERFGSPTNRGKMLDSVMNDLRLVSRPSTVAGIALGDIRMRARWLRTRRIAPSSWIIRRNALPGIGLFDPLLRYSEDLAFLFRAFGIGPFAWSERVTAEKRIHAAQATSPKNAMRNEEYVIRALSLLRATTSQLSPEESDALEEGIDLAAEALDFAASGRMGLPEYLAYRAWVDRLAGRRTPHRLRYLVRASLTSLGLPARRSAGQ